MSHPVLILILVLALPTLEIYLLIQLGSAIGFFGTLLLVLGGAVLGGWLLRHQGLGSLARIRAALERGESPTLELLDGLHQHLTATLRQIQFAHPQQSEKLLRRLRRLFNRARLDLDEINILRGLLDAVERKLAGPGRSGSGNAR